MEDSHNTSMESPFLTVITRHFSKRVKYLQKCKESLSNQTDPDYQQILLIDDVGRGMDYANKLFTIFKDTTDIRGKYVLILDDDDVVEDREFIKELKKVVTYNDYPDIIYMKGKIPPYGILPSTCWGKKPQYANIGSFNFVIAPYLYLKHINKWGTTATGGDFKFIEAVHNDSYVKKIHYWDRIICSAPLANRGKGDK